MACITVKVSFDDEAQVWWIEESTMAGLRLEDASLDALMARIPGGVTDLIETTAELAGDSPALAQPLDVVINIHRAMTSIAQAA